MRGLEVILTAVPAGIFCKIYGWRSVDLGPQGGNCQGLSLYIQATFVDIVTLIFVLPQGSATTLMAVRSRPGEDFRAGGPFLPQRSIS